MYFNQVGPHKIYYYVNMNNFDLICGAAKTFPYRINVVLFNDYNDAMIKTVFVLTIRRDIVY